MYFVALVVSQWGHLISIRQKKPYFFESIMNASPQENSATGCCQRVFIEFVKSVPKLSIVVAITLSAVTAVIFTEIPALQQSCGTGSVSGYYWGIAIGMSGGLFIIAEVRKWLLCLCPTSLGRLAW